MIAQLRRVSQRAAVYALARQEALTEVLGRRLGKDYQWEADLPERRITFSSPRGEVRAQAQVLASVAVTPPSLVWGFAAPFAPYVGPDPAAARIRQLGAAHGIEVLQQEEAGYEVEEGQDPVEAAEALSHDVGMLATVVFGSGAMYYSGAVGSGGSRQVFLLQGLSLPVPEPTLSRLFPSLTRYTLAADDIDWSLDGLVDLMPGWSLSRHVSGATTTYRLADAVGHVYTLFVTRDAQGRVTDVLMT
ncbi:hypothetical protein D5R93_06575 [Actinomyces lilanjuaniae]|uniref:Uncharacterized protein n=1 Tax=Actinomyces lilanjuaniae TaxID=2321394 RepID=A0ABN5PNA5_9ACTO|nr:DUF6882 domain-containing protein [Actinomyces lilanjuaniae]AYD89786.1 hypothetical protein D5R93_06575 [Actinomyces lilanjuaniae]